MLHKLLDSRQYFDWGLPDGIATLPVDGDTVLFKAQDTGVGLVEVARLVGAADPYFQTTLWHVLANTTAPSAGLADKTIMWSQDRIPGFAGLCIKTEDGTSHIFADWVGIGTLSPIGIVEIVDDNRLGFYVGCHSTDALSSYIISLKSRGTRAAPVAVESGDTVLFVEGMAYIDAAYHGIAYITVHVDGAVGAGDWPSRIGFWTCPDGSATVTERMRINNAGNVGIGVTTFDTTGVRVLAIGNGTAPAAGLANAVQMWSADRGATAGKAGLHIISEDGTSHMFSDRVGIGTLTPTGLFEVMGAVGTAVAPSAVVFRFIDNTALAANVGACIALMGTVKTPNEYWPFGVLKAYKLNATSDDVAGGLIIYTIDNTTRDIEERFRITSEGVLTSLAAEPTNVITAGAIIAGGGLAFSNVLNAWIDDATHGNGTTPVYIGNQVIAVLGIAQTWTANQLMSAASIGMSQIAAEPAATADRAFLYALDLAATRCTLGIATEEAVVTEALAAADSSLVIRINGASYKLMLVAV